MTPEEKAEKWMKDNTKRYNLDDFTCHKFSRADCIKAYLAGYAEAKSEKGIVANALKRQGIDPDSVSSNLTEVNSKKRFESDL